MITSSNIQKHMEVRDASGAHVGTVDGVETTRIKLTRKDSSDGMHHYVDFSDIERVDAHVHLKTIGLPGGMHSAPGAGTVGGAAAAGHARHEAQRDTNWLAWIALLAGIAALLFGLSRCSAEDADDVRTAGVDQAEVAAPAATGAVVGATATAGVSGLGTYLAGTEAAPRRFTFEQLNFDSGSAAVREADAAEIAAIARTLTQYPAARIELVGFADARGDASANATLGRERADAIKAALVEAGIEPGRITTASGGESNPVEANATAGGRAENRRTELVVTTR